jgi:hypothetical protein
MLPASLADALERLLRNPEEIARRRERTVNLARQLVRPWSEVVENDIALIKSVAVPAASNTAPAPIKQAGNR